MAASWAAGLVVVMVVLLVLVGIACMSMLLDLGESFTSTSAAALCATMSRLTVSRYDMRATMHSPNRTRCSMSSLLLRFSG